MPTESVLEILNRTLPINKTKQISEVSSLLQEIVNYATHILIKCPTSKYLSSTPDADNPVFALYRSIIQTTDGIEVLISHNCLDAAIPLARNSFEIIVSLEYILADPENYEKRSLSWLVNHVRKQLDFYERCDPNSVRGQETLTLQKTDAYLADVPWPLIPITNVLEAQNNLENILIKHHMKPIVEGLNRNTNWYSAFQGPKNFRELAKSVNYGFQYEMVYRKWSNFTHAQDFNQYFTVHHETSAVIRELRNSDGIEEISTNAATYLLAATRKMINKFLPEINYRSWFIEEIQTKYNSISGI